MNPNGDITVKPEIMLLEDVLGQIAEGRLRVPKFQRSFVWRPEQMIDLFDSIERGYPVGSLLVWDTSRDVQSLDKIANVRIPPAPNTPVSYLLDGHQRLTTLYGCLMRRPPDRTLSSNQDWVWNVYRVLGESDSTANRFRHWKQQSTRPPDTFLPMRAVLRTMDFLQYARDLASVKSQDEVELLVDEAEQLAQRIKSYKIAVVRLVGGDLQHAVEVFSRLNSSGQPITPAQMVSALTYDEGESLADRIETLQNDIGDLGFGQVPTNTLFQAVLAVSGENDVQHTRWEALAERVKGRLDDDVKNTETALHRAVRFLQREVGVPLARLIPYNAQLMLLTACFHEAPEPTRAQMRTLVRWFWSTSWSGFFAGANTTQIRAALTEMRMFAKGGTDLDLSGQVARPFPERFDLRSARVRAYVLWELREFSSRLRETGDPVDPVDMLIRSDASAYRQILAKGAGRSSPANRLVMPTPPGVSVKRALLGLPARTAGPILESHGIPLSAWKHLQAGREDAFRTEREAFLAGRERDFMRSMGIDPPAELVGDADIDTG